MAVYTNFGLSSSLSYWFSKDASSIASATSSTVDLVNTDGTHTVLTSSGNDFTFTNVGGVITLTGGTITSMARTDGASTTYERVTGLSYAATSFQGHLADSDLQGVASDILAGADTFTGGSLNDFIKTFGGNDTVNGGAGFDTVSYLSTFMTGPVAITVGTTNTVGAATVATGTATAASNTIGTDSLNGVEQFIGTNGNDTYTAFANFFSNGSNYNQFEGLGGNDTIIGNGNTRIAFNNNSFSSGPTGATLTWTNSASNTNGSGTSTGTGIGTDTFSGVAAVYGSQFNDTFTATGASNASYGVLDNGFTFIGGAGNDALTGGGTSVRWDFNIARYDFETSGITATEGTTNTVGAPTTDIGSVTGASAGTDTLHYIEAIRGTNFADTYTAFADFSGLYGTYNEFEGMAGNDTITGNGNTRVAFGTATAGVTVTWTPTVGNAFTGAGTSTGDSSVGTDTFTGVNAARGSQFDDTFTATGAHGNFQFDGRGGNDTYNGGTFNYSALDFDTAAYTRSTSGITVMMDSTSTVTGDSSVGTDTLNQIEEVRGSQFNDTYTATSAFSASFGKLNVFAPGGGDDSITGNGATQLDYHATGSALAAVTVNLNTGIAQSTVAGDLAQIGTDTFTGVNGVRGSQFDDTLIGSDGAQAETFRGEEGNDHIDGGLGSHNQANYSDSPTGVVVNLTTGTASDGWGGTDTLVHIQDVSGSEFNDTLTGDSGNNILIGKSGDDTLFGGGGDDILIGDDNNVNQVTNNAFGTFAVFDTGNDTFLGSTGNDTIYGGLGTDTADYSALPSPGLVAIISNGNGTVNKGGSNGSDSLNAVEKLVGSTGGDVFYVDKNEIVAGGGSFDYLIELSANVNLSYGTNFTAISEIVSNTGTNTINATGDTSQMFIYGSTGTDTLTLGSGGGFLFSGGGTANVLNGGTNGVNFLIDSGGTSTMNGGGGTAANYFYVNGSNDTVQGAGSFNVLIELSPGATVQIGSAQYQHIQEFIANSGTNLVTVANTDSDFLYLYGGAGDDTMTTGSGGGYLFGLGGTNVLTGGGGTNVFVADNGSGVDTMNGGTGSNLYYIDANSIVHGAGAFNNVIELQQNVSLALGSAQLGTDVQQVILNGGTNSVDFHTATTQVFLYGASGDDTLFGGTHNDFLYGGAGTNTFTFGTGWGKDTIGDWALGTNNLIDLGALGGLGVHAITDLTQTITAGNDVITSSHTGTNSITLIGVGSALTASSFHFT